MSKVPDRLGQVIGQRYELLQVVGRGGQGMVYRANDQWLGRTVAIKVLGSKAVREPHMVERLMREQQAMSALRGTAAVELFDVCRGPQGELCLVMELLKGADLDEHLYTMDQRGERLSLQRVVEIFDPIVSTLETAHAAGILHRDLKPANIFLLEGGQVRLLDFGMARLKKSAPLTAAGTVMGSPSFMAPEAWKGVSDLMDQRADVYSLGVILFRVLAGQLPFEGDSLKEKLIQTTTSPRPSLLKFRPELPRAADDWVATVLAVDREQRFGSVRALWNAFLAVFDLEPPQRGPRASLWAAARGAVQRIVGGSQPAPPQAVPPPPPPSEPSFAREALAKSVFRISPTPSDERAPEPTMELRDDELLRVVPPPPRKPPPPRPVEKTMSMTDAEIAYEADSDAAQSKPR
ncbi:MAG TPA: serine/threonine-protein kinase [Polyangiaceae bacterium]|nr:serine/threonine-protein kinase [Polyangiaceae bacterium]